jgi:hypothetical protein
MTADSFTLVASILQPSLCKELAKNNLYSVQRPASGIDHVFKHPLSSNNVDMIDQQMMGPNAGYENTPSYHN